MDIHFPNNKNQESKQMVSITIECEPVFAEWILALSTPFASNGVIPIGLTALPEAILQLGSFLEFQDDMILLDQWSPLRKAFILKFIELTKAYSLASSFDAGGWKRNFLQQLDQLESELGVPADVNLFNAIRSVVQLVGNRLAGRDLQLVYCDEIGTPLTFNNWADRLLADPKITDEVIASAHLRSFDPIRLRELMINWKDYSGNHNNIIDDEIPF
jgi:hypothetical protein